MKNSKTRSENTAGCMVQSASKETTRGEGKMKSTKIIIAAAMLVAGAAVAGFAQESDGWEFEITPYLWYAGLEGDVTVNGTKTDFERSASDLFDAAEVGGSLRLTAEYNRFVIGGLVDYFSLSTDELDVEDQPQGGRLETKILLTELMAGYRVDGWSEGQTFVLGIGVRNLSVENDVTLNDGSTASRDNDVTDVMFYVLPSMPMFASRIDGLRFNPWVGIGAGDSDIAYDLFPQIQYHITDNVAARLGYRTAGWKFKGDDNEDNELNIRLAGLIVGLGVTF